MRNLFTISIIFAILIAFPYLSKADGSCTVSNCTTCSQNNICTLCTGSLKPSIDGSACVQCDVPNCDTCVQNNVCGFCLGNYILIQSANSSLINGAGNNATNITNGTNGTAGSTACITCDLTNCQSCSANNFCGVCLPKFTLINGSCTQCNYPCGTCDSSGNCATCQTPLYYSQPQSGKCLINLIPNCLSVSNTDTSLCASCAPHFSLNSTANTCNRKCPYPCLECDGNICLLAEDGFYIDVVSKKALACGAGCQACTSNTVCTRQMVGFYLKNGEAAACPSFCKSCSSQTVCLEISESFIGYVIVFIGGKSRLVSCNDGCASCSPLNPNVCVKCQPGFYNNNEGQCKPCGGKCKTCGQATPSTCLSCFQYSFLSSGACLQCDSTCLTCTQNALSTCLSCRQGSYLQGGKCIAGCPDNCLFCSDATTCIQCQSGYTVMVDSTTNQTICGQCISTCRQCAMGQPGNCLACGDSFYNSGQDCLACSSNCQTCTSKGCAVCSPGYYVTQSMSCAENCIEPCQTCSSSDPTKCTSCVLGYQYNSQISSCLEITTCNGTCLYAPLGYVINGSICIKCTGLGCRKCSLDNLAQCTSCKRGYIFDSSSNSCKICPIGCTTCLSATGCSKCAAGYTTTSTAISGTTGFLCLACSDLCATCISSPKQCTSCISGYTLSGWQCVSTFTFTFITVLSVNLGTFYRSYFVFMGFILSKMKITSVKRYRRFRFRRIKLGSVIVDGAVDPDIGSSGSWDARGQFDGLLEALNSGNIAGMPVISSSTGVSGGYLPENSSNIGLILGICIPVGILILAAIVVIIVKLRSKKTIYKQYKDDDQKMDSKESFEYKNQDETVNI